MDLQLLLYVAIATALYVVTDRIVRVIERRTGRTFRHRSLLFVIVVLVLLLAGLKLTGFPRL